MYLACDGPRPDNPQDREDVASVRRFLLDSIDWNCETHTLFQTQNLGCGLAIGTALDWFFEHEEAGIVLEDDCLPDPAFFGFCDRLLDRYADDPQVMHISGACLVDFEAPEPSYFFSNYPQVWGWASWRNRWQQHDIHRRGSERDLREIIDVFLTEDEREYWKRVLTRYWAGEIDTWDYGWASSIWRRGGLSVYPTTSLVKNIGFSQEATHTKAWKDYRGISDRPLGSLDRIAHPAIRRLDRRRDLKVFYDSYAKPPAPVRVFKSLARLLRGAARPEAWLPG